MNQTHKFILAAAVFGTWLGSGALAADSPATAAPEPVVSAATRRAANSWERRVVTLEVALRAYDYGQPWTRKTRQARKSGVVVGEREILTTADHLFDQTLVRLQKGGRGQWFIGEVTWIDYPANMALVTTKDDGFWEGLEPARIGGETPEALQIVRWREGNFENRHAEFSQFVAREGMLAPLSHAVLEMSSDLQNAGWSEPVIANDHVVGLLTSQDGRTCTAMTAEFIQSVLEARRAGKFKGLGFFHFYWQPAENTDSLKALGLTGDPRGVIVHVVPNRPDGGEQTIREKDIILKLDGFELDIEGDYLDPELGHMNLENLATRKRWAGDKVPMTVWRDGKEQEITYVMPKYRYEDALVPFASYDKPPEYLMIGGLIFQPLNMPFLQGWGSEWKRRAPFRLQYYGTEFSTKERPSLVLLTQILPDPYNIGYQDLRYLVIDKVNGKTIRALADLKAALGAPQDGFHVIEFVRSDGLRRMVLAAGDEEIGATERVLKRYGIPEQMKLN